MKYKKITADKIFDGYKFLKDHVLITDEEGIIKDLLPLENAGDDIEICKGIMSPGFINCHCHLELSHMKGLIPERTGLVDFIFKIVTERHHAEEEIIQAVANAENEMLKNGIVAVGDICNNTLTLAQKEKARMRYYNFIETSGWPPSLAETRFERAKQNFEMYAAANSLANGMNCSIVPHAPYSVSQNLWQKIQPYFENKVVSIHNQETVFEDEYFLQATGDFERMYQLMNIDATHHEPTNKSSLQSYFYKLEKAVNIILVHNTFTKQEDIDFIKQQTANTTLQTFFCLCVNANQYIENASPPIEMLQKNKCTIVLGTDSLASNRSLNILDEIKTIKKNFPSIALEEILGWATSNGAKALQMDGALGSFEKGRKPGVVLLDEDEITGKRFF